MMGNNSRRLDATVAGKLKLGKDIEINRMGFGTMRLPGPEVWGEPTDPANAKAVLRQAFEWLPQAQYPPQAWESWQPFPDHPILDWPQ